MYTNPINALKHFVVGIIKCQLAGLLVWVFLITPTATGQSTAFTYQGRLTDSGVPPTGNYDIGTSDPTAKLHVAGGSFTGISVTSQSNAVVGLSSTSGFAAIYGENTSGSTGYGVYGKGTTGYAMFAEGNAGQSRDKGGLVKFMVYVGGTGIIERCYNGLTGASLTGGTTNTGCGFSVTSFGSGAYIVDFGFPVHDRFYSATPSYGVTPLGLYLRFFSTANRIEVFTYNPVDGSGTNGPFCFIIY